MMWKKLFSKSPSPETPFCEEVGLFEDAAKAILDGSEPWQIESLQATINSGAFNLDEQKHLHTFVVACLTEKRKEIMRVALTKVLTGNGLEKELATKVATLGKQEKSLSGKSGQISQAIINDEYLRQKMKWQQEEMMQQYQNAAQFNMYTGAGGVPLEKIENPFSSK